MIKPHLLKQWILLLITSFALSACFKDSDKNSDLSLPAINPNLSTESPIGIWLWHIDIEASEEYQDELVTRENHDRYFIRQLVVIEQAGNEGEVKLGGSCSYFRLPTNNRPIKYSSFPIMFSDFELIFLEAIGQYSPNYSYQNTNTSNTDLPDTWQLSTNNLIPLFHQQPIYDPLVPGPVQKNLTNKSGTKSGTLLLENNLSLSGELNYKNINSNYDDFNYQRQMSIRGVKLSDQIRLSDANEIALKIQLNQDEINLDDESILGCLRTVVWKSELTEKESGLEVKTSFYHELATAQFSSSGYLQVNHDLFSFKRLVEYGNSSPYNSITNLCLDNELPECQSAITFNQAIKNDQQGFSIKSNITNYDGEEFQANISIIISH